MLSFLFVCSGSSRQRPRWNGKRKHLPEEAIIATSVFKISTLYSLFDFCLLLIGYLGYCCSPVSDYCFDFFFFFMEINLSI